MKIFGIMLIAIMLTSCTAFTYATGKAKYVTVGTKRNVEYTSPTGEKFSYASDPTPGTEAITKLIDELSSAKAENMLLRRAVDELRSRNNAETLSP